MSIHTQHQFERLRETGEQDFWMPEGFSSPCSPSLHLGTCGHFIASPPNQIRRCNPAICNHGGAGDQVHWPAQVLLNAQCLICRIYADTTFLLEHIQAGRGIQLLQRSCTMPTEQIPWEQSRIQVDEIGPYDLYRPLYESFELVIQQPDCSPLNFLIMVQNDGILNILRTYQPQLGPVTLELLPGPWPSPYGREAPPLPPRANANNPADPDVLARQRKISFDAMYDWMMFGGGKSHVIARLSRIRYKFFLWGRSDFYTHGVYRAAFIISGGISILNLPYQSPDPNTITLKWIEARLSIERENVRPRIQELADDPQFADLVFEGQPDRLTRLWKNNADRIHRFEERLSAAIDQLPDHFNHMTWD